MYLKKPRQILQRLYILNFKLFDWVFLFVRCYMVILGLEDDWPRDEYKCYLLTRQTKFLHKDTFSVCVKIKVWFQLSIFLKFAHQAYICDWTRRVFTFNRYRDNMETFKSTYYKRYLNALILWFHKYKSLHVIITIACFKYCFAIFIFNRVIQCCMKRVCEWITFYTFPCASDLVNGTLISDKYRIITRKF